MGVGGGLLLLLLLLFTLEQHNSQLPFVPLFCFNLFVSFEILLGYFPLRFLILKYIERIFKVSCSPQHKLIEIIDGLNFKGSN